MTVRAFLGDQMRVDASAVREQGPIVYVLRRTVGVFLVGAIVGLLHLLVWGFEWRHVLISIAMVLALTALVLKATIARLRSYRSSSTSE